MVLIFKQRTNREIDSANLKNRHHNDDSDNCT